MKKLLFVNLVVMCLMSEFTFADTSEGTFGVNNDQSQKSNCDASLERSQYNDQLYLALSPSEFPSVKCVKFTNEKVSISCDRPGVANIQLTISYFDESNTLVGVKDIKTAYSGSRLQKISDAIPIPFALLATPEELAQKIAAHATVVPRAKYYLYSLKNNKDAQFVIPQCLND